MKDVMLDLETLGTRHDALILQIGACYFDRMTGQQGEKFLRNVKSGDLHDRFTTDHQTVMWWLGQTEEARLGLVGGDADILPLATALTELAGFLWGDDVLVWSHVTFDMPILANAFEVAGLRNPIPYRNTRDLRTLMDITRHLSDTPRTGTHHNALADAQFQAMYAAEALQKLHAKGF